MNYQDFFKKSHENFEYLCVLLDTSENYYVMQDVIDDYRQRMEKLFYKFQQQNSAETNVINESPPYQI